MGDERRAVRARAVELRRPQLYRTCSRGERGTRSSPPQGHFHYFENASDTEDRIVLIVFNADSAEPLDDVPLAQSISSLPPHVLAAVFGVDESVFAQLPVLTQRTVIVSRRPAQD